jgi:major intracellular serine protease
VQIIENPINCSTLSKLTESDLAFLNFSGRQAFYKQGYFGQNVVVAVVDTGVSPHAEFEDRLLTGKNTNGWYFPTDTAEDDNGHGTHVAGTIAGKTCGIAPKARILPVKALSGLGEANALDVIGALQYIKNWRGSSGERVDIVNMSISDARPDLLELYHQAVRELVDIGIVVIVAAGNTGAEHVLYPAYFPEVITVGAVDINKGVASFSTRSDQVDLCQVGVDVASCSYTGGYEKMSGTSMATPIVSGIAALMISKYKAIFGGNMPEYLVWQMLKYNTVDIGTAGIDKESGAGFCTLQPLTNSLTMVFEKGSNNVLVNGANQYTDAAPLTVRVAGGDRYMVPLRFPFEKIGAAVTYDSITKKATIKF